VARAVPRNSVELRAKARVATIRALAVRAVTRNSPEVRVATIRALAVRAVTRNCPEVRVAPIRARSAFLAKVIGFAAVTSPKSTSCPTPMVACLGDFPAETFSRLTGQSPPTRSSLAGHKALAHASTFRTLMAANGSFARAEVAPALELRRVRLQVPNDASCARYSWAPQPVARNGTFFLYVGQNASGVGVAKSTSPTSGFKDAASG